MMGQFGEVAAIKHVLQDVVDGYFVDVGAHNGVTDSNTLYFEKAFGWKGICMEPHRIFFQGLKRNRGCVCLELAAWDEEGEEEFFATGPGGWSRIGGPGLKPVVARYMVKTQLLDRILEEHGAPGGFELLSVDVEGTEWHVLRGFNLDLWLPRIVVIEDLSMRGQFDEHFGARDYIPVKSWEHGIGGSNVIYCREPEDFDVIDQSWGVKRR